MTDRDGGADGARQGSGAPDAWVDANDSVLRGLAHLLSNRTGTIGAVAEALGAAGPGQPLAAALAAEAAQLDALLRLLRILPRDLGRGPEPVRPADVVADAAALFAHHEAGRGSPVSMVDIDEVPPVRVRVPALIHALLVLLAAAAGDDGAPVSVRGEGGDGVTLLRITGDAAIGPGADAAAAAASSLLAADGAGVTADGITIDGPAFVVSLPSLRSARQ